MPDNILPQRITKLHEAVAAYCEMSGMNAATVSVMTEKILGLLASRWQHICDAAHDDENEGKINLTISLKLDMTHKTPVGAIILAFTPQKIRDDASFAVEDPDAPHLPFDPQDSSDSTTLRVQSARRVRRRRSS